MPTAWTTDQVLTLAPDDGSAKSGKGLADVRHWSSLGCNESVVWGECKGSGAKPYQTRIALEGPAFKCTCPSRKFPCKHSLGLFLVFVQNREALTQSEPPGWVADWLKTRGERAQKKAERAADAKPPDPEEQARRLAKRESRVEQGVAEISLWLHDLVRHGLAWAQMQPMSFWNNMAARMVDAQAPGLARRVREMALTPASGEGWHSRLLEQLFRLYLLIQAWGKIEKLDEGAREDVRAAIGFTVAKETVIAQPNVSDTWLVMAREIEEEEDGIRTQRIWLWGRQTRRPALVLSFAHRTLSAFDFSLPVGGAIDGTLAFYPSAVPLRALVTNHRDSSAPWPEAAGYGSISSMLEGCADALALNPWLEKIPVLIDFARLYRADGTWTIADCDGKTLPVAVLDMKGWHGLAVSGGRACSIFGEWDGNRLRAKSVIIDGRANQLTE